MLHLIIALVCLMTSAPTPTERYLAAARAAGCPRDQVERFIRAGIVLQPKQLAASAAARLCDQPCDHAPDDPCHAGCAPTWVGYGGARGGGKSHWAVAQVAADDCQRYPGLKCLVLRKVGKAGKENFDDLRRRMLMSLPHQYRSNEGVVEFANGSRILNGHFQRASDIDAYLGLEYDVIVIEEATTLTWGKIEDISSCNRSSKRGWRPRIYATTNPGNIGHAWFKSLFVEPSRRRSETETRFIAATARDNSFNNAEYLRKLLKLTGWKRRAWLDGDWDVAAGQYFKTFRRAIHVPEFPAELPAHWRVWMALDYGLVHYTMVYLFAQSDDGDVFIWDEHGEQGWLPSRHAEAVYAMLARHRLEPWRIEAIVAGHDCFNKNPSGSSVSQSYEELGLTLTRADIDRINGAAEILAMLGDFDDAGVATLRPRLFISERCHRLIDCLPLMVHDDKRPEDVKKVHCDEDGNGGDDSYDACRYGVMHAATGKSVVAVADPTAGRRWGA